MIAFLELFRCTRGVSRGYAHVIRLEVLVQRAFAEIVSSPFQAPSVPACASSGLSRQASLVDLPSYAHLLNGYVSIGRAVWGDVSHPSMSYESEFQKDSVQTKFEPLEDRPAAERDGARLV